MKIANINQTYYVHLFQIFLPLYNNDKQPFDKSLYDNLRSSLKNWFGGVSFYRNQPIEGAWEDETGKTNYDELVIVEVMVDEVDKKWWQQFKKRLEQLFEQKEILIRSIVFEKL